MTMNRQFECNEGANSWDLFINGMPKQSNAGGGCSSTEVTRELINKWEQLETELKKIKAERDKYKKLWDVVITKARLKEGDNCDGNCEYLKMFYCTLFKVQMEDDLIRCAQCFEIFGGE